jgi:hypothetical protein
LVRVDDFEHPLESPLTRHVELPPGAVSGWTAQAPPLALVETFGKFGDGLGLLTPGGHRQRRQTDQAGNGVAHALGTARGGQPSASVSPQGLHRRQHQKTAVLRNQVEALAHLPSRPL